MIDYHLLSSSGRAQMIKTCIEYGPHGPQGPWAHKTKLFNKNMFVSLCRFPKRHVGILDTYKTSLLALAGFQTTFGDFGHLEVQKVDLFDYVRTKAMLVLVF